MELNEPERAVPPEQRVYARWLDWSTRISLGVLIATFLAYVGGLSAPLTRLDVEFDLVALVKGAEARAFDRRVVHENVLPVGRDETVTLAVVEPLDGATRHGGPPCKP